MSILCAVVKKAVHSRPQTESTADADSVIAQVRALAVRKRGWLTESEFAEGFALAQSLPGTNAGNSVLAVALLSATVIEVVLTAGLVGIYMYSSTNGNTKTGPRETRVYRRLFDARAGGRTRAENCR